VTEPLIYPEFSEPWIRAASVVIASGDEGEIDPVDLLCEDYDVVVDKVQVFECNTRDPAADIGADSQLLGDITGRYWLRRCQNDSLPEMPVIAWDDARLDRTIPIVHGMQEPEDFAVVGMDLRRTPLIVPINGALTCSWENPTITANFNIPAGTIYVAASCRGRRTRRRTTLYLPVTVLVSSGSGVAGPTSKQAYQDSSKNRLDEELELYDLRVWVDGDYGAGGNFQDARLLRHLLIRPIIEPGTISLSPATELLPLVAYGKDRQADHSVVTMDWSDDPLPLLATDGLGFKFSNNSGTTCRVFVVLHTRRRPTR
jgi:hypothetical protein